MTNQRADRGQAGFSLLEMLIAFAILATAATSLFLLGSTTMSGNTRSKEHAAASALAVEKIEELRNTPFDEVASDTDTVTSGGTFNLSWTVTDTTTSGVPAKNVTVTVTGEPDITVALTTAFVKAPTLPPGGFPTVALRSWSQR
jgi:prepilin-type N-terminal cleavage/methylation domain-containing protein